MNKFTDPLSSIRVASPCPANWNEMYGNERKRFCAECKLNVYNLSGMTRDEAENLLIASEGQVCVRFFRRADGTVLTKGCPVGWRAVRQRLSRTATAAFSVFAGLFGGLLAVRAVDTGTARLSAANVPPVESLGSETVPLANFPVEPSGRDTDYAGRDTDYMVVGRPYFYDEELIETGEVDPNELPQADASREPLKFTVLGEGNYSAGEQ